MGNEAEVVSFRTGAARFELERGGGFSVYSGDDPLFKGATARVLTRRYTGRKHRKFEVEYLEPESGWRVREESPSALLLESPTGWGRLLYRVSSRKDALVLETGLRWEDDRNQPPSIDAISPLSVPPGGIWPGPEDNRHFRFYSNGWQCWTPSGVLGRDRPGDWLFPLFVPSRLKPMLANTATPVISEKGCFTSEWFGGVADLETSRSVALGFIGVRRALSQVSVRFGRKRHESEIAAVARFDGKRADLGSEMWSEPLAVIPGDLSPRNLELYAELVAGEQGARVARRSPPGWCSWYQYFAKVRETDVRSNLELMEDGYPWLGIELVQVDDGYQRSLGEWLETNEDFPGGMESLSREIAATGRTPGIWVAPFTVTRNSRLFKERKDWLIRNARGRPVMAGFNPLWKGRFYGLDPTNPEVLDWLRDLFSSIVARGYRFIKLDFLACGMLEGSRFEESLTRAEAFTKALGVIREAAGDDTYILAAGGPILLGTGVLDAQRVGGDVAPYWDMLAQKLIRDRSTPGVRNSLINVLTRSFLSGRLWEGDPDCMLARGSESRLTPAERRTLASGIALLGGAFIISDNLGLWGSDSEELAACVVPPFESRPSCPDLWTHEIPRYLVSGLMDPSGPYQLVWMINWAESTAVLKAELGELGLEPGHYHACEFWSGKYLGEVSDKLEVRGVPPHGSAVVRLTPVTGRPRVIGSGIHLSQGAVELKRFDSEGDSIRITVASPAKRRSYVTVFAPGAALTAEPADSVFASRIAGQVYRVEFDLEGARDVVLSLEGTRPGEGSQ